MNETYKIKVKSPLLRPGMEIETEVSRKYLVDSMKSIMEAVRTFNELETVTVKIHKHDLLQRMNVP